MSGPSLGSAKRRREVRARLMQRQDGKCFYCGRVLKLPVGAGDRSPNAATFDHFIPKAKGGAWGVRNIVLACYPCNEKKGDKMPPPSMLTGAKEREKA